jgi:hypothetical protein
MRRCISAVGALAVVLIGAVHSGQAYTFTLTQQNPDVFAYFLNVTYTASGGGSGTLNVSGFADTFAVNGVAPPGYTITGTTTYTLTANINAENLQSGTLTIDGNVVPLSLNTGVLLTGNLTGLSYQGGQNVIYITFATTGGAAAGLYGADGGIILNMNTAVPPASTATFWNSSFSSAGSTVDDNFSVIPEPVTGVLTLLGLGTLALACRRQTRRELVSVR